MLHRPLLRYAATGLVWWVALGGGVGHAEPDHDRILFLHLALEGETVTLREQAVRPGSLKQPRRLSPWAEIVYELRTSSGEMLWRGAVGDPSLVSHDSVPGESGHYNRAVEGLGSARFVIRVPVLPDADNVVLYRQGLVAGVPGKTIGHILLDRSIISRKPGGTQLPQGVLYTLQETGLREERINLVIVGEAYTQLEESLFLEDADRTLTAIMSTQPFVEYVKHYNLYAIFVASAESGPDRPAENLYRDTYFNSYFREDRLVRFPWQDDDLLYDSAGQSPQ